MEHIKSAVKDRYAKIATAPSRKSCCGDGSVDVVINKHYSPNELGDVQIAYLGLGCGSPTAFSEIKEGMHILDLGSGAGIDVFIASKHVGPAGKVIGLDMTPEMIERAKHNAETLEIHNVEFRLGEIEQMPVDTNSIDLVISNCVINLVPDKSRAFAEIYRVLKPGGTFSISDMVTVGTMPEAVRNNPELWSGCVAGALDKGEYLNLIAGAGFKNVEVVKETKDSTCSADNLKLSSITVKAVK